MITRLVGAVVRGVMVALVVATPALLLPQVSPDTTEIVALIALFALLLTTIEYGSAYPSLIEFRDAPPFNRVRILSLFLIVFLLATICRGQVETTSFSQFVEAVGLLIWHALDFPFSPLRLMEQVLPAAVDPAMSDVLRAKLGMACLVALMSLGVYVLLLNTGNWPSGQGGFNVWINLPTFDPSTGDDVVLRLRRDARLNCLLGIVLPFLLPMVVSTGAGRFDAGLDTAHTLVWVVATWAFLPASLFMRGIAMGRVAAMIEARRRLGLRASGGVVLI